MTPVMSLKLNPLHDIEDFTDATLAHMEDSSDVTQAQTITLHLSDVTI